MNVEWNKVTWYSKLLALMIFVLLPLWGFLMGLGYQEAIDQYTFATVVTSTPTPSQPSLTYAPTTWKVWETDGYDKVTGTYHSYILKYPRDFDATGQPDANGGFLVDTGMQDVRISFPRDAFKTLKTNYNEAYVSVSQSGDAEYLKNCYVNPLSFSGSTASPTLSDMVTINGITFHWGTGGDAAAGNRYASEIYRTIHDNRCYEIALTVHTGSLGNYPAGTVTEFDQEKALTILHQILNTFTFTSVKPY